MIELVDFNDVYTQNKNAGKTTEPKKKTRRAGAKKPAAKKAAKPAKETTEETTEE
jgi:hypothetical protein